MRLELSGITKAFPACIANDHVDFNVKPGEIHALLGENGAGKSTLVKMIYGIMQPDEGQIIWEGHPVQIDNPGNARKLGIGMVFQHFSLFESMTVLENVALGINEKGSLKELAKRIIEVSEKYGLPLDPVRHIHTLSVGERQRVEIVRCLLQDPSLIIMDEPTSVLTPQEVDKLFVTLRRLREEGRSILYISHKLDEIKALCDRATILRAGKVVGGCDPSQESARSMAQMMVGEEIQTPEKNANVTAGEDRLVVENLSMSTDDVFVADLDSVGFSVKSGEIFGIAGVAGNGQNNLLSLLSGERLCPSDNAIRIDGVPVAHLGPQKRRKMGMAFVPEERLGHGTVPEMSLADNTVLSGHGVSDLVQMGWLRFSKAHALAKKIIEAFDVRTGGSKSEAKSLSGGNLQKFIIGRELLKSPRLLIVAQPTWGVDAGAAAAIHQALMDLRDEGCAILVVSQDLDELFAITDRMAVISHGRLSEARETHETSVEQVGLLMGGLFDQVDAWDEEART
ncbi:ABC transporter ATP-binding protein [Terasakiella sp. A23]|uniref:ABC transporter ATP-binding protein n=1 Tax=Terasakiella sp. FCG-A23 TaxID=3080561 RepID=UPI0029530FF2|nr:ABC transporter ATP-binding protein [Terasakiella sp. A23]MDV7340863.1 ABC transporter ATP-binding protein [Terasakiella sp. A23]